MRVVVTGGSGRLGTEVVRQARAAGLDAVPASRRTGLDLATGDGLRPALAGADAVVHCATDPLHAAQVDVAGARRLARACAGLPRPPHLVAISIVGCDLNPYPYYRAKAAAEEALAASGGPVTLLRATQFHSLAAFFARVLTVGPVALTIGDMAIQPVDLAWVAGRLLTVAQAPAPAGFHRARDVAGPDLLPMGAVAALVRRHAGHSPPRVLRLPPLGATMRAFSKGSLLPGPEAETGGTTFEQWLAGQPLRLRGR